MNMNARLSCLAVMLLYAAAGAAAEARRERVSPRDGAAQVYVTGGEFVMGADTPEAPLADEQRPPHPVRLAPFWMDKYEVTNEQFARYLNQCIAESDPKLPDRHYHSLVYDRVMIEHPLCGLEFDLTQRRVSVRAGQARYPAMPVRWSAALEYAQKMGRRLPTEAEWEYAARGADGRRYPWGNDWNPKWANVQSGRIFAVDAFPHDVSPFGIVGLGGNVREWVQDRFELGFYAVSPKADPVRDGEGAERVIRGGSYAFTEWDARATSRYYGTVNDGIPPAVGFRTVENAAGSRDQNK